MATSKTKKATKKVATKRTAKANSYNRSEISRKLRTGERTALANQLNLSNAMITMVLQGKRNNDQVLAAAYKMTSRRK